MVYSTRFESLSESLWDQEQARQTRFIAAQEQACERGRQAHQVLDTYSFSRDEANCRVDAQGVYIQCAMRLTHPKESLSVVCKLDYEGDYIWFITDMTGLIHGAGVYITAVQCRLAHNRDGKGR